VYRSDGRRYLTSNQQTGCLQLSHRRPSADATLTLCCPFFLSAHFPLPSFPVAHFSGCCFFPLPLFLTLIFCCPLFLPNYFSLPNFSAAQFSGSPIFRCPLFSCPFFRCRFWRESRQCHGRMNTGNSQTCTTVPWSDEVAVDPAAC